MKPAYRATLSSRFKKVVRTYSPELQARCAEAVRLIKRNPFADSEAVQSKKHFRRVRVGDYRILFGIDPKNRLIRIGDIKSRGDAYKSDVVDLIKSVELYLADNAAKVRVRRRRPDSDGAAPD